MPRIVILGALIDEYGRAASRTNLLPARMPGRGQLGNREPLQVQEQVVRVVVQGRLVG